MNQDKNWILKELPLDKDIETKKVLKNLPSAHAALAELKGIASKIPNQNILINTLGLQEAKDSSAIENIITTNDDLYKSELNLDSFTSLNAKEVQNYVAAVRKGFELILKKGFLTNNIILRIQKELEGNDAEFRKLPGTELKNSATGEVVYTPPQDYKDIERLMDNLEKFINSHDKYELDPLVKMAIIHYQFESIHLFYDGNGRTGRIINILYLLLKDYLEIPILYLSSYIIKNKAEYYQLLREVTKEENWEQWLLFILKGIEITATETIQKIKMIKKLFDEKIEYIRENIPKVYSKELVELLFENPYCKVEFLVNGLGIERKTASVYLHKLSDVGLLEIRKIGRENIFINKELMEILKM